MVGVSTLGSRGWQTSFRMLFPVDGEVPGFHAGVPGFRSIARSSCRAQHRSGGGASAFNWFGASVQHSWTDLGRARGFAGGPALGSSSIFHQGHYPTWSPSRSSFGFFCGRRNGRSTHRFVSHRSRQYLDWRGHGAWSGLGLRHWRRLLGGRARVAGSHDAGPDVAELQTRIQALEAELAASRSAPRAPAIMSANPKPRPQGAGAVSFYGQQRSQLNAEDWAKLKKVVGSPPAKLGAAEARRASGLPNRTATADTYLAEEEKEATNESQLVNLDPETGDPFQRLLMSQMQQNTLLMTKLLGNKNHVDPMSNLLAAGGGNESGSSSSGAKGCIAREMFMKQIQDSEKVAALTRLHALQELGIPTEKEDSSLLRKYFERRVPLADQKLLAHFASLISEGWALAAESDNVQMLGFLARAAFFVEQTALDGGRLELSWLLTGFTEPNAQFHFSIKKTPGLKPFSRLIHPLWLSANIAFLRDLDFLENRLATLGKGKSSASMPVDPDDSADPKPKRRPKKQKKGGGKENSETKEAV